MRSPGSNNFERSEFNRVVGLTVRDARTKAAMSIAKLAEKSGMSTSMLTSVEHGQAALPLMAAAGIAFALDLGIDDLVPSSLDAARKSA